MLTAQELMNQACMTAHDYMNHARSDIDAMFGAGYAAKHPELIAAYMQAAATDFLATFGSQTIADSIERVADNIGR